MSETAEKASWWNKLLGKQPRATEGELKNACSGEDNWNHAQELTDARRLIDLGKRTNDQQTVKVGQARLRFALGKPTPDDEELLDKNY